MRNCILASYMRIPDRARRNVLIVNQLYTGQTGKIVWDGFICLWHREIPTVWDVTCFLVQVLGIGVTDKIIRDGYKKQSEKVTV